MGHAGRGYVGGERTASDAYLGIVLLDPGNACDLCKSGKGRRIVPQCILIRRERVFQVAHLLSHSA